MALTAPTTALGQESADFLDLSVAQLAELDVVPINALGTHTHLAGEWMLGYRFMTMKMAGNREGTASVAPDAVLEAFMVSPLDMRMSMHMAEIMYAPSNRLTLMAMLAFHQRSMGHVTRMGHSFTTRSSGFGDVVMEAMFTVAGDVLRDDHRLVLNARITVPTGSLDERGDTPVGASQLLPYPMRSGSGTVDLSPALTYLGQSRSFAWMGKLGATARVGPNSHDYSLGNRAHGTAWLAWGATPWLSPSVELEASAWGNIDGADPDLNPAMVPTADPTRRGGRRLDLKPGVSLYAPGGMLEGHRLSARLTLPVYQSLDGPQLKTDWAFAVGWTWTR